MSKQELIAYIKEHRTDDEAIHELFVNRRDDTSATWYPAPLTEEGNHILEQVFQEKLGK